MPVWYASYGSNLSPRRFGCYLRGGTPVGASRAAPGARDASPPMDERAAVLPGSVVFGGESPTWGGGVAFLDAGADGEALARAYLITEGQFADVAAQEMHRDPGADLDLGDVLERGRQTLGPGRYETLHLVGELDGHPVLTFTAPDPDAIPANRPSRAYLVTMARGLRRTHGLGVGDVVDYLLGRPGMSGWDAEDLASLVPA